MKMNLSTHHGVALGGMCGCHAPPSRRAAQMASATLKPPASTKVVGTWHVPSTDEHKELRQAFGAFVGQTLFGQMLRSMRKTVGKPAYFYGGPAEEIFTEQLDQLLAEKISDHSGERLAGPMFELFAVRRT